ncbi:ABC transporter substrate-binding protein [Nocardioides sp.]|uniref:ABC transporter substrate-binding protein n=1 Tax=Nocardioides sp. TaxID=35761 RepID=UPI0025E1D4B6|nr:ABC transporter substrate-binding protein [Nocardioides sp.]
MRSPLPALPVLAVGALCVALVACGSQLDPDAVAQVNGTTSGDVGGTPTDGGDGSGEVTTGGDAGSDTDSGATTRSDTGGGSSGPVGGTDGGGAQGTGDNAAAGGAKAGSCEGFENQTGITDDTITIANASDISGPVPGIFESAQQATRAYVAYFNSTGDICGRKLAVQLLDSRADAGADQQAYTKACDEAFAAVGSMSAFDSGGAGAAQGCGLPDIRSTTVTPERRDCTTCFAAQAVDPTLVPSAMPKYFLGTFKDATQHAALLYINAGAAPVNAEAFRSGWGKAGWRVDYFKGIDVSEFNYAPYVQQMKDEGIRLVVYVGPYQNTVKLLDAMKQQGFEPDVFLQDSTIYDQRFVDEAGDNGDGVYAYSTTAMFDDTSLKEMALYRSWLDQVKPGAVPNYYGLYAWSATRLFVEKAVELGGKLSRESLVAALKGVKSWTGNGLHAPNQVGSKTTANCQSVLQLNNGTWRQVSPGTYMCAPLITSGTGS